MEFIPSNWEGHVTLDPALYLGLKGTSLQVFRLMAVLAPSILGADAFPIALRGPEIAKRLGLRRARLEQIVAEANTSVFGRWKEPLIAVRMVGKSFLIDQAHRRLVRPKRFLRVPDVAFLDAASETEARLSIAAVDSLVRPAKVYGRSIDQAVSFPIDKARAKLGFSDGARASWMVQQLESLAPAVAARLGAQGGEVRMNIGESRKSGGKILAIRVRADWKVRAFDLRTAQYPSFFERSDGRWLAAFWRDKPEYAVKRRTVLSLWLWLRRYDKAKSKGLKPAVMRLTWLDALARALEGVSDGNGSEVGHGGILARIAQVGPDQTFCDFIQAKLKLVGVAGMTSPFNGRYGEVARGLRTGDADEFGIPTDVRRRFRAVAKHSYRRKSTSQKREYVARLRRDGVQARRSV